MTIRSELVGPGFFIFFQHVTSGGGGGPPGGAAKFLPRKTAEDIQREIEEEDKLLLRLLHLYFDTECPTIDYNEL